MSRPILIVEDEAYLASLLSDVLEAEGYEVVLTTGSKAVERVEELRPAAVILDYLLPGKTGAEVAAKIREALAAESPPLILVSGLPNVEALAQEFNFDGYLRKPFDLDSLVQLVDNVAG